MTLPSNVPANPNASTEPVDSEPTLDVRLQELAHRVDELVWGDEGEQNSIMACLEEESTNVFEFMRDTGQAL